MSALHWFEIPVNDIQRAVKFYEQVLGTQIPVLDLTAQMGSMIGMLPNRGGTGGALVQNAQHGYVPASMGTLVYLVVEGNLTRAVETARAAGAAILLPPTPMGEGEGGGFIAWINDTEGNRIGLFAQQQ